MAADDVSGPPHLDPQIVGLAKKLDDKLPGVRLNAARELGKAEMDAAAPHAMTMASRLVESDGIILRSAEANLKDMREAGAAALATRISTGSSWEKTNAIMTLAQMDRAGAEVLVAHLADESEEALDLIMRVLAQMGEVGATALVEQLASHDVQVRKNALTALGWMSAGGGPNGAAVDAKVDAIQRCLKDLNGDVQRSCVLALVHMGAIGAKALVQRLADNNDKVREIVSSALRAMRDIGAAALIDGMLDDKGGQWQQVTSDKAAIRRTSSQVLQSMGETGAAALAGALKHPDAGLRRRAADALGMMGDEAVPYLDALAQLLDDDDHWVQVSAARAVGKMGTKAIGYAHALESALQGNRKGLTKLNVVKALHAACPGTQAAPEFDLKAAQGKFRHELVPLKHKTQHLEWPVVIEDSPLRRH